MSTASDPDTSPATLVAVASKDNRQIDEHFGHADEFKIYRVTGDGATFVETRVVEHYCQGGYGDEDKREVILRALADCRALFVARVGEGPKERLRKAGIDPVDAYPYGLIEASLMAWYRKG